MSFAEWTPAGHVRHASFLALRQDKLAAQVRREYEASATADVHAATVANVHAATAAAAKLKPRASQRQRVAITHGERCVDSSTGTTKADLVAYFDAVADWLLPELKGRPVALLRAPQGVAGALFFQKHLQTLQLPGNEAGPGEVSFHRCSNGISHHAAWSQHSMECLEEKVRAHRCADR